MPNQRRLPDTLPMHILVQHTSYINKAQQDKNEALYNACLRNNVPVIKEILLHPTKLNIKVKETVPKKEGGGAPTTSPPQYPEPKEYEARYAIRADPGFVNRTVQGHWTPLLVSSSLKQGSAPVVKLMLQQLFENRVKFLFNRTHDALPAPDSVKYDPEKRHFEMRGQSKLLFKHRPWMEEIARRNSESFVSQFSWVQDTRTTILTVACQNGATEVVREICDFVSMGEVPEVLNATTTTKELTEYLGDEQNTANDKRESELINTFIQLQFLLLRGLLVRLNFRDKSGSTAVFQCAQGNHFECLKLLINCSNQQQKNFNILKMKIERILKEAQLQESKTEEEKTKKKEDKNNNNNNNNNNQIPPLGPYLASALNIDQPPQLLDLDLALTSSGSTPLHVACEKGHVLCVRTLLLLDIDDEKTETVEKVRKALQEKTREEKKQKRTTNPVASTSSVGDGGIRALLRNQRAENAPGGDGEAVHPGLVHFKKIRNEGDQNNNNEAEEAIEFPRVRPAKTRVQLNDKCIPVFIAAIRGHHNTPTNRPHVLCLRTILEFERQTLPDSTFRDTENGSLNFQKSDDKATPLFAAVQMKSVECVRELVCNFGADVNIPVVDSTTPLFLACATSAPLEIIDILCGDGHADVNRPKKDGATAVFVACQVNNIGALRLLCQKYGGNVNQKMDRGAFGLLVAAEQGHVGIIECLLGELGAAPDETNDAGASALLIAVEKENLDVVRALVKHGADARKEIADDGTTPLFIASFRGKNPQLVEILLSSPKSDPNVQKSDGATAVFAACQENRPEFLKKLLADPRTDPNIPMKNNQVSPSFICVVRESLAPLKLLAQDPRTKLHKKTRDGADPVLLSIQKYKSENNQECLRAIFSSLPSTEKRIELLINAKTQHDGFVYGESGSSVLIACCEMRNAAALSFFLNELPTKIDPNFPVIDLLKKTNDLGIHAFFAAALHSEKCLKVMSDFILDNTRQPGTENSSISVDSLSTAIIKTDEDRIFLKDMINLNVRDGATPLFAAMMAACQKRDGAMDRVRFLLDTFGSNQNNSNNNNNSRITIDINRGKEDGATPLFMACQFQNEELVHLLLLHGADPRHYIKNKSNCLHVSCEVGNEKIVQLLLRKSRNFLIYSNNNNNNDNNNNNKNCLQELIHARNEPFGMQPIWVACTQGNVKIIKLLLDNGAEVNSCELKDNVSTVFMCAQKNFVEALKLLLTNGADPNICKTTGKVSPLIVAAHQLHKEAVEVLLDHEKTDAFRMDANGLMAGDHVMHVKKHVKKSLEMLDEAAENEAKRRGIDKMPQEEYDERKKKLVDDERRADEILEMIQKKFAAVGMKTKITNS